MWFIKFKSRLKLRYIKALRIRIASKFSAKSKFSKFLNSCSIMWRKVAYFLSVIGVCVFAQEISTDVNLIKFVYYDASAPSTGVEIVFNDVQSLTASGLKAGVPTTLVIDGFLSNGETPMPKTTKNALIQNRPQENVIIVDWGALSGSGTPIPNQEALLQTYVKVLPNIGPVGRRVAQFLHFLKVNKAISSSQVHIVGHSLGSHISGAAGSWAQRDFNDTIARITGLDPAGPFFSGGNDNDKRLHKEDATFVDIYHTNRNMLGDKDHKTGDVNVYVNGGDNQPGCEEKEDKAVCSHSYSWRLYDLAYTREIEACPCTGFACQCKSNCQTTCSNPIRIGDQMPTSARGAYHLLVSDTFEK
ncbi:lipase member H [Folsomia candida]|uniref:lipase member H n=1 Tax=Folsomia candida TaxID=158441 RepID=UPI001604B0EB|nr:lipase member H [Folsomia candida]